MCYPRRNIEDVILLAAAFIVRRQRLTFCVYVCTFSSWIDDLVLVCFGWFVLFCFVFIFQETFDEFPVVVHWFRQILAAVVGIVLGVMGVTGAPGIAG